MSEAAPFDPAVIQEAVHGKIGLIAVNIPGRPHPLWLRCGSEDAREAARHLRALPGGLRIPYQPARILELGAGAGFRSIALAAAFADAHIIATESDPAFRAVNLLNTLPFANITSVFTAVSATAAGYGFTGRGGQAGRPILAKCEPNAVASVTLADLLARRGWAAYDTVIIHPDAASRSLLATPWPPCVRLIAVFTGGARLDPEVASHFSEETFHHRQEGEYILLLRREVEAAPIPPLRLPIFNLNGPPQDYALVNVSADPWGFFPIGAHGFRLHPNRGGAPAARLIISQSCAGYRQITARLRVGYPDAAPISFAITVTAEPEGREIFRAEHVVNGGQEHAVVADVPPYFGPCRVVFATKMAQPASANNGAWAEILDAAFA